MKRPGRESPEVGGADTLDVDVARAGALALLRSRSALGLEAAPTPALVFVPLGIALGPRVSGVLSDAALAHLDLVVSVALAALGVFVGLALDLRRPGEPRLLAAATLEAAVTIATVGACVLYLLGHWGLPVDVDPLAIALTLGIGAAASAATADPARPDGGVASRVADLDDILPIVAGGVVLGILDQRSGAVALLTLLTLLLGIAIGAAGLLLFERSHEPAERTSFIVGALLLAGGAAASIGGPPLLCGLAAGMTWKLAPGAADAVVRTHLGKIQHPLVVLLLLIAGAMVEPSATLMWLLAPFIVFRLAGKLVGGWLASRIARGSTTADLGAQLLAPGVLGIAFALNVHQMAASGTSAAVLGAVVLGSLAFEVLGLLALLEPQRR